MVLLCFVIIRVEYQYRIVCSLLPHLLLGADNALLLRNHALFQLYKYRVEFASGLLDVAHGRVQLVGRVETAQIVARDGCVVAR